MADGTRYFDFGHEITVDLFAGGGGASLGIEQALGRSPDVAVNHSADAIATHQANHPDTVHMQCDVFEVDPLAATGGRPVGLLWASPDCKHFSKAKGGKPRSKKIRSLAWVVIKWAKAVHPRVIILENVEEFVTWGPLGRDQQPDPRKKGDTFRRWMAQLRACGYKLEHRELRACDYGAPTIRKRFFLVARCDGRPIVWPKPTHGKPGTPEVRKGKLLPWRTAAECLDFTLPCPSIFLTREEGRAIGVKRPLADATMRRIAKGIKRFVLDATDPFIVPRGRSGEPGNGMLATSPGGIANPGREGCESAVRQIDAASAPSIVPCSGAAVKPASRNAGETIPIRPDANRTPDGFPAVATAPFITEHANASGARSWTPAEPLRTECAEVKGGHFALCAAFLEQANAGGYTGDGRPVDAPLSTVCGTGSQQRLVTTQLMVNTTGHSGAATDSPVPTITTGGHIAEVRAFLIKFYREGGQWSRCDEPLHTIPTKDRMGLVTVAGVDYAIADIGLRMLTPRELYRAQGFPDSYIIDRGADGRRLSKAAQVRACGNSVCPPLARALVLANLADLIAFYAKVAA